MPEKGSPESDQRLLGWVEVDSGTLIIADPSYVLPWKTVDVPGVDYAAVVDANPEPAAQPFGRGEALLLQGFGGDGSYPVYGEFEGPRLRRASIHFDEEPADD